MMQGVVETVDSVRLRREFKVLEERHSGYPFDQYEET